MESGRAVAQTRQESIAGLVDRGGHGGDGAPVFSGQTEETGKTRRAWSCADGRGGKRREGLREDVGGGGDCGAGNAFSACFEKEE